MTEIPAELRAALAERYDLHRVIGQGGMATVYLARDRKHDRDVAVKVLRPDLAASLGTDRFLKEIEIAARLTHPHIVALFDSGASRGFLYYVMPFVDGESLRGVLRANAPLSVPATLAVTRQVADALGYAHRMGVLHRDIKPENILLADGHAFVVDFGIAKAVSTAGGPNVTRTGFALGTPGYMSPEQAAGIREIDERTDVYGLACVVYEMLVGEPPGLWVTETAAALGRFVDASPAHRERLDGLPGRLEQVLARSLALRATERFPTIAAFLDALTVAAERSDTRYSDVEIREIVGRAARLQALRPTEEGLLSIGGVERLAAEVGIPPEDVRRALAELDREPGRAPLYAGAAFPPPEALQATDVTVAPITVDRVANAALPVEAFPLLVQEIGAVLGQGRESVQDRALTWRSTAETGQATEVTVAPRGGATVIRIRAQIERMTGLVLGGIAGAMVGGFAGLLLGAAMGGGDPSVTSFWGFVGTIGGSFGLSQGLVVTGKRQREKDLNDLADRLTALVESAAALPARRREAIAPRAEERESGDWRNV
jgi:tRNA A-37 threonylcarbamoyl transferase component Bud32